MKCLKIDVSDQNTLDANGVSKSLNEIFTVALLLTGNPARAEFALLDGIETLDRGDASAGAVMQATIRAAITSETNSGKEESREHLPGVSWLPLELQQVMLLPKGLRHVFVLRLLLGLPRDQCSQLLQLDDRKLDERVGQSANFLAQRHSFTRSLSMSTFHSCK
jgi:hypothetical protein